MSGLNTLQIQRRVYELYVLPCVQQPFLVLLCVTGNADNEYESTPLIQYQFNSLDPIRTESAIGYYER